jgi:hypothetical protein
MSDPDTSELNQGQTSFALLIAQGLDKAEAWVRANLGAYTKRKVEVLLEHPEVIDIIKRVRQKAEEDAVMNLVERRRFLAEVVRTPASRIDRDSHLCQGFKETVLGDEVRIPDKLKCIELDSKLSGDLDKKSEDSGSALASLIAGLRGSQ